MKISIFRNNILVVIVNPDDSSELSQIQQTEDLIRLNFTLNDYVDLKIGDYISYGDSEKIYRLNSIPTITENPKNFRYDCIFESEIHELKKVKAFLYTQKSDGTFYKDYKFSLTGNARTFLEFVIFNLNRNSNVLYKSGTYKETEIITVDFNNWNIFETINTLSEKLNFNWFIENGVLSFDKKTTQTPYVFMVGRLSGFTELIRTKIQSKDIFTVVYGYGSKDNLPPRISESGTTYDSELLTENRLSFSGENGESKISKNTDLYGILETVKEFDEVKPSRIGTVTNIDVNDIQSFFDTSIDFDVNDYLIPGITAKINFISGLLIGQTFQISFDYTDKRFTCELLNDETGTYPNSLIHIATGDSYTLTDIYLPQEYIIQAQDLLKSKTQSFLDDSSKQNLIYEGKLDPYFVESRNIKLNLGDLVRVVSGTFGIDQLYDVKEIKKNINNPTDITIKFGDILPLSFFYSLKYTNFTTKQSIYNISKSIITNNEVNNIIGQDTTWEQL